MRASILKVIYLILANEKFLKYPYKLKETMQVVKEIVEDEDKENGGYSDKEWQWIRKLF